MARSAGVVDGLNNFPSHLFSGIKENYFDLATTPALRATPPVPGGELVLPNFKRTHYLILEQRTLASVTAVELVRVVRLVRVVPVVHLHPVVLSRSLVSCKP